MVRVSVSLHRPAAELTRQCVCRLPVLHIAASAGQLAVVRCLTACGAGIEARTKAGATPMHAAAQSGALSVVKFFASAGASVESKTADGAVPLHIASQHGHAALVRYLIEEQRSDPNVTNDGGVTCGVRVYSRRISMKPKPALEISLKLQQNGNFIEITRRPGDRDRGQRQTALKTRLNDRGAPRCEWHITTTPQMTTKTQTGRLAASFSFNNVRLICIQLRARRA